MRRRDLVAVLALLPFALASAPPAAAETQATPAGWDAPQALASYDPTEYLTAPHGVSDSAGRVYAAWRQGTGREEWLGQVAVRDPASGAWTEPAAYGGGLQVYTGEMVRMPDDQMVVVFLGQKPGASDWYAGFQVVNADGSLGTSERRSLAGGQPFEFTPSVTSDGDLVVTTISFYRRTFSVLHSKGLGRLQRLELPTPPVTSDQVYGVLVDPSLDVTVVLQKDPQRRHFGRLRLLELEDGAWERDALDREMTGRIDRLDVGRDGNATITWTSDHKIVVGTRLDGAWSVDVMDDVPGTCEHARHLPPGCGKVAIGDDNEVIATWLRSPDEGPGSDAMISRRDPITGTWSPPEFFLYIFSGTAGWPLEVGAGGEVLLWRDSAVFQCERGESCASIAALAPNDFPSYADTTGSDLVTVYKDDGVVWASTYHW